MGKEARFVSWRVSVDPFDVQLGNMTNNVWTSMHLRCTKSSVNSTSATEGEVCKLLDPIFFNHLVSDIVHGDMEMAVAAEKRSFVTSLLGMSHRLSFARCLLSMTAEEVLTLLSEVAVDIAERTIADSMNAFSFQCSGVNMDVDLGYVTCFLNQNGAVLRFIKLVAASRVLAHVHLANLLDRYGVPYLFTRMAVDLSGGYSAEFSVRTADSGRSNSLHFAVVVNGIEDLLVSIETSFYDNWAISARAYSTALQLSSISRIDATFHSHTFSVSGSQSLRLADFSTDLFASLAGTYSLVDQGRFIRVATGSGSRDGETFQIPLVSLVYDAHSRREELLFDMLVRNTNRNREIAQSNASLSWERADYLKNVYFAGLLDCKDSVMLRTNGSVSVEDDEIVAQAGLYNQDARYFSGHLHAGSVFNDTDW